MTDVLLENGALDLIVKYEDAVDYHRDIYLRKVTIVHRPKARHVRLSSTQSIPESSERQNTAVCDPALRSVLCYRSDRWVLAEAPSAAIIARWG